MTELNDGKNSFFNLRANFVRLFVIIFLLAMPILYLSIFVFNPKGNYIVIINESAKPIFNNQIIFTLSDEKGEIWQYVSDMTYTINTGKVKIYAIPKPFFSGTLNISDNVEEFKIDFNPHGRINHSLFVKINDDNALSYEWDKIPN